METQYYKTRDLAECAVLLMQGIRVMRYERIGKTCWFYFTDPKICKKISDQYFFGELLVNARVFYQTITQLKNKIFAGF